MGCVGWQLNKAPWECTKYMLENEINCDVNFKVGENEENIKAHKFILSMRSPVFDRMFNGGFQESVKDPVIPDVSAAALKTLLRYCYYECFDIDNDVALSVLYAATKYMLPMLEEAAREKLIETLSRANVWDIYRYAISVEDRELLEECQMYFEGSISTVREALQTEAFLNIPGEVLLDLLHINAKVDKALESNNKYVLFPNNVGISISEIELFKACNEWAEAECLRQEIEATGSNKRIVLGEVFWLIRFPVMLQKDLAKVVYPTGVLTQEEIVNLCQFKHQEPGSDCEIDFPSTERQFVVTAPEPSRRVPAISTVYVESEVQVMLSRVWIQGHGTYRITVHNETSDSSWSMKYGTKHKCHCTTRIGDSEYILYFVDIKPCLLESGSRYSITAEETEVADEVDSDRIKKWVVIGDLSPFKEVKITTDSKKTNTVYALTLHLV